MGRNFKYNHESAENIDTWHLIAAQVYNVDIGEDCKFPILLIVMISATAVL